MHAWLSLSIFLLAYLAFALFPARRSWTACAGAAVLILAGVVSWRTALLQMVNWNVMGLFFGTLLLAELFMLSKAPAFLAEWLVDRVGSARNAMLALCMLSGFISMFVENVAVVLLVAPVALSLADRLRLNPVPLLVGIAVSSNLQGTATMIGDPPSMILAGFMRMGFWDFFAYQGRPGIFFAVQAGALASLFVLAFLFRKHRMKAALLAQERVSSWVPAGLLGVLILGLSFSTAFDPGFNWFAGIFTLVLGVLGALWFRFRSRWGNIPGLLRALDWDTTLFLIGVFVLVGALGESGWLDRLADLIAACAGAGKFAVFASIVLFAVVVSGFVDNVPFLLVMIPVVQKAAAAIEAPIPLLMFGLLIGACLGGNLTPIGASANVVALGILKKHGHSVGFREFARISVPFTLAAVTVAGLFVWAVWHD